MNGKPIDAPRVPLDLDWYSGDIRELRKAYADAYTAAAADTWQWDIVPSGGHDIRVLIHHPSQLLSKTCAILYFHGGGWIVGSPSTHAEISNTLSNLCGLRVLSVDYRLAPEHPAPDPIEDGLAVLETYLTRPAEDGGIQRAILCGDSAGGAIAVALERIVPLDLRSAILGVCSFYGGFGAFDAPSVLRYGTRKDGMDRACLERYWRLANRDPGNSPYAVERVKGPSEIPAYLVAAETDPVVDGSIRLAEAMRSVGRDVTLEIVPSQGHGFLQSVSAAQRAGYLKGVAQWIAALVGEHERGG